MIKILLSIDRINSDKLICEDEDGNLKIIPIDKNMKDLKEGSIIEILEDGQIILKEEEYKKRIEKILELKSKINYEK